MGNTIPICVVGMSILLAGCSVEPRSIAESEHQGGLPTEAITARPGPSATAPPHPFPQAGWLDGGAKFAIVFIGSSSCPIYPSSIEVLNAHHVKLGVDTRGRGACTDDLAPRTHVIRTPAKVDVSREVTLQYGEMTLVLPPL